MDQASATSTSRTSDPHLTLHAVARKDARGIPLSAVLAALDYGRVVYTRGAAIHVIGRRDVERHRQRGVDLSAYEGVQVVCSSDDHIITVYRNRDFRGLRPRRRRSRRQARRAA